MPEDTFAAVEAEISASGPDAAFEKLAAGFREQKKYHELFDTRLMQTRHRMGLPVISSAGLDELPEPKRSEVEEAYLEACREVGLLLMDEGRFREAWMYLRPAGDKAPLAAAIEQAEPTEENLEEMIEICLHEGVAPVRGFALVLENYGTCNAITTFEGALPQQTAEAQVAAAEMLLRHLHDELLSNVEAHVAERSEGDPQGHSLAELVAQNEWIFQNDNYHIDTSHLASTVRFARLIEKPDIVRLALDLTEYGRRLSKQFQFPGEEPFEDVYPSHGLLFAATLGERVDEAVEYFRARAEQVDVEQEGTAAIETYLILLSRLGRDDEALEALAQLVPPGVQLSGYAPKLFELAKKTGNYARYLEICRARNDLLAYAAGLVDSDTAASGRESSR